MYGYPKKSLLFHTDKINRKNTFVFLARRKDFLGGVWEIVRSKMLNKKRNMDFETKDELREALLYEVSK